MRPRATRWGKHDALRFADIIRNVSNYVENMSKRSRNALAWEMTWDELILQECHHIQDRGGGTCIILRKLLACLIFLVHLGCYGTNMNQLPRYLAFHSTIEIQVALHCHHVDERIKLRTIALAKYQWRIVFGLWFSKSRKSKHHPIIPTGIPAFTKNYTNFMEKTHGFLYLSKT